METALEPGDGQRLPEKRRRHRPFSEASEEEEERETCWWETGAKATRGQTWPRAWLHCAQCFVEGRTCEQRNGILSWAGVAYFSLRLTLKSEERYKEAMLAKGAGT